MIRLTEYRHKSVAVFGLGRAGLAAVKALLAGGATVYAWDDGEAARQHFAQDVETAKHGAMNLQSYESWPWEDVEAMILSPGVPLHHPEPHPCVVMAKQQKVRVRGEVDMLYEACPHAYYVGVTGTNGKSTTSALLEHILRMAGRQVQLGANFGTPSLALKPMEEEGVYVLEMSSYQLDLTEKACFNASILLNITPDHIDRHGSMENYVAAKQRIFDRQAEGGLAAIGLDDGYCRDIYITLVRERHHVMLPFATTKTMHEGISVDENGILHDRYDQADPHQFDLHDAAGLKGRHNWQNIAASYGVCRHLGVAPQEIMDAVYAFPGLPHRLERVGEAQGVVFYNDSKATNAEATSKALEPFETIYWIIGGRAKEGGIDALEPYFPRIAHAFLMGEAEDAFAQTLEGKVPYTRCGTLEVATQKAAQQAFQDKQPEAVVLLSPACASFDQWRSFEERGDAFRRYVSAIAGRGAA